MVLRNITGLILFSFVLATSWQWFICFIGYAKKDKKKKDSDTATTLIDTKKTVAKDSIKKEGKPQFKTIKEVTEKCKKDEINMKLVSIYFLFSF